MTNYFHSQIVNLCAKLFAPVRLPEDLSRIRSELTHTILITQSHSIIMQGLILSLARKLGYESSLRLDADAISSLISKPNINLSNLCWASMHDLYKISWPAQIPEKVPTEKNLAVRTLNVFQVKGPIRKWPSFKPSFFWLWGLIPTRRILTVTVGVELDFFQASSHRLLRLIKIDFIRTLKLVRGPPFEPREEQARAILSGPDFERELRIVSERSGISVARGRKLAEAAFYELAASPRRYMYDALSFVARSLVFRLFSAIHTSGLEKLIPAIKEHTVVLVPMHRSHLDYVLVGYKLFSEKVNPPLVAAGINLAFWPFGFIFRSVGAYFVKRNARDRFHTIVLKRYVAYLVNQGHLQEFFIEGGRSRSGKMLPPKLGLLSIIIDAWKPEHRKDILFVPVSITYENVIEDEVFGKENSGGSKVRESIGSTLKAFDVFRKRYGDVLIEFGEPISHKNFRTQLALDSTTKISEKSVAQKLGYEICRAIRDQSNPGLTSLSYTALLMARHYGLSKNDLVTKINALHQCLQILRAGGVKIGTDTPQLSRFLAGEVDTLNDLSAAGVVKAERHFGIDYFFIPGNRRFTADYYRNSVLHYFLPITLCALSQLSFGEINESGIEKLYPFFEHDLLLDPWPEYLAKFNKLVAIFESNGVLTKAGPEGSYHFKNNALFFPALVSSHIQAYQWVLESLKSESNNSELENQNFQQEKFIEKLLTSAKTATYLGTISKTEAAARSSILSILHSLESRHLIKALEGSGTEKSFYLDRTKYSEIERGIATLRKLNLDVNRWLLGS